MRDTSIEDDEWSKEPSESRTGESVQSKNRFGSHRRGHQSDTKPKTDVNEGWSTNNSERQNGRAPFAVSGRGSPQTWAQGMNSRTSPRSHNEGANRFVFEIGYLHNVC